MPVVYDSSKNDNHIPPDPSTPSDNDGAKDVESSLPHKTATMGAFVMRPTKIHFATQGRNEHIILFLRKHPITQTPWILTTVILIFLPFFVVPVVGTILSGAFVVPLRFTVVFLIFWYLVTFAYAFVSFILWYYNINIVTNQRVIDIDFLYLLVQEVTATRIAQVEDVTYRRVGSFATLFDYGNVFVQTAGTEVNIEFLAVPKPKQIAKIVVDLMGQTRPSP